LDEEKPPKNRFVNFVSKSQNVQYMYVYVYKDATDNLSPKERDLAILIQNPLAP